MDVWMKLKFGQQRLKSKCKTEEEVFEKGTGEEQEMRMRKCENIKEKPEKPNPHSSLDSSACLSPCTSPSPPSVSFLL